ncbi:MAG: sigma-70 family RNA polymerase sigma factor [Phycisphaerales bacterium]|nr:MAG: sigma-70 family RNA polymerase sigma factor [Phycisphaerales bacterium]
MGRGPRPASLEDAKLIESVKAGQTEAYGELVRKYQDRVFNACWRICGHLEDARDLTQEAFLKGYERLSGFRQESGFYTWIFRIVVNLALSHRRQAQRRRDVSLEQGLRLVGSQADGLAKRVGHRGGDDPAEAASEAELHGYVVRALQVLDDDHRAVIVLRDIEGFNYQEIAEILEIPPGTVKSRVHRARLALCQAIRPAMTRKD